VRWGSSSPETTDPDLVLLDLHLPDMSGEETLSRLRADGSTKDLPVIVMSAEQRDRPDAELISLGISGYLPKPIDVHAFLELVDRTFVEAGSGAGREARR
jgi:CheY-like chemotaxis protein